MADYRLNWNDESRGVFYKPDNLNIPPTTANRHWREYLDWKAADPVNNVPDPLITAEDQAQADYDGRQNQRVNQLKGALINQFKMILALFQVGRDKGVWTVSDFDSELVTIAQQWIALIDEYENDAP